MKSIIVPDKELYHIWKDPETGQEVSVHPDFYQNNGTPVAESGGDMEYVRTGWCQP